MGRLRTICEVHRQLYRLLKDHPDPLIGELLHEAFDMGKKMDNKLRQYKHGYDEGWWKKNRLSGRALDARREGFIPPSDGDQK